MVVDGLAMGGEHSNDSRTAPFLNCPGIYVSGVAGGRQGGGREGAGGVAEHSRPPATREQEPEAQSL